jgi:hypothetical protein
MEPPNAHEGMLAGSTANASNQLVHAQQEGAEGKRGFFVKICVTVFLIYKEYVVL